MKLISVVLDTPEDAMMPDTTALLDYGFGNFWKSTLVSKNEIIKTVEHEGHEVRLISLSDILYVHPIGESYIKEFEFSADLKPPLKKTTPARQRYLYTERRHRNTHRPVPESEIVPVEDIKTRIQKRILENKDIFLIVAVLVAIEALLLVANVGKLIAAHFVYPSAAEERVRSDCLFYL